LNYAKEQDYLFRLIFADHFLTFPYDLQKVIILIELAAELRGKEGPELDVES
jgi:hypothetical protein